MSSENLATGYEFVPFKMELNPLTQIVLKNKPEPWDTGYGAFSEFIFYRTYSRDGEKWWNVIRRIIEGTFSIRKSHYLSHGIPWNEEFYQAYAHEMALSAHAGEWGPPGRGYWANGIPQLIYAKGGMALNNCGFVDVKDLGHDVHWAMDALMMGVGVGFSTWNNVLEGLSGPRTTSKFATALTGIYARIECPEDDTVHGTPFSKSYHEAKAVWDHCDVLEYVIPDSREGWCDATKLLIDSYYGGPVVKFNYTRIRPRGARIEGFGGEASGPAPLKKLHRQLRVILNAASSRWDEHRDVWTSSRLITDIINLAGCCVVAGNVRRSATIALGRPEDKEFAELKHYCDGWDDKGQPINKTKYWYRRRFGWMSNNSYTLTERHHFEEMIPVISDGIKRNGEPGFLNMKAIKNYGRMGDRAGMTLQNGSILREDPAVGINPCGEVPLESYELCCLAEWYPTRCLTDGKIDKDRALKAAEYAAFYTQTIQLLPTHRPETNEVIRRNRRTGVSLAGAAALREMTTMTEAISLMELGYEQIRRSNKEWSLNAGVPEAIRVTAEKPSGTTSLMMGVPAGCHWPTSGYIRRAARVDNGRMSLRLVLDASVPHEPDLVSANTEVYYFPVKTPGAETIRAVHEVTMWEQADFASTLAQHFVDNAVSVTITFDPLTRQEKEDQGHELMRQYGQLLTILEFELDEDARDVISAKSDALLAEFAALQRRQPEGDDVERLVASYVGKLKSMAMLPRSGHGYLQAPETAITQAEYEAEAATMGSFDWSSFLGQGVEEVFCSSCEVV